MFKVYETARSLGFPQINVDLIAGMLGETDANYSACLAVFNSNAAACNSPPALLERGRAPHPDLAELVEDW